jgi:dCMP deaminase
MNKGDLYLPRIASIRKQRKQDILYLDNAYRISEMSFCNRSKVGCLLVTLDNICIYGWNGTPTGHNNSCEDDNNITKPETLHAELNAISKISKSTLSSVGSTMYLTLSPCIECAKIILQTGISRLVYSEKYRDDSGLNLLLKEKSIVIEQIECNY